MHTDPISDMLTRMRNAAQAKKSEVALPFSKFKQSLAELFKAEGFLSSVKAEKLEKENMQNLVLGLKYTENGQSVISGVKRVSKPGQRIYLSKDDLPRTNSGFGVTVVSTSRGLMTDRQARKQKVGGEVICQIW